MKCGGVGIVSKRSEIPENMSVGEREWMRTSIGKSDGGGGETVRRCKRKGGGVPERGSNAIT